MSLAHKYIHRKDQQQAFLARKPGKDETVKVDVTDDVLMTARGDDSGEEEESAAPPRPALVNRRRHGKKRRRWSVHWGSVAGVSWWFVTNTAVMELKWRLFGVVTDADEFLKDFPRLSHVAQEGGVGGSNGRIENFNCKTKNVNP